MKERLVFLLQIAAATMARCSGFFLNRGYHIVTPKYLSQFEGGGSLSTLWYCGSDEGYHYFLHFVKTKTKYRISRRDLNWKDEFVKGTKEPSLVEHELSRSMN